MNSYDFYVNPFQQQQGKNVIAGYFLRMGQRQNFEIKILKEYIFKLQRSQLISMLGQGNINEFRKKIENYSFCLTDRIGKGYSSIVYKGRNDITNQIVAIKVIQLKSLKDQVSKNLLRTQLECIRSIHHENLLKYIDSYQTVNNCYIITEYCEGGDLEKQLKRKIKFTQSETKNIFLQFYAGYKHFLQCGYIHRDLKPANIFLQNRVVKVADFGFVKRLGENPKQSYNVGTPVYMPPQSLTSNIYTEKSDVWSIGVICYQFTHGKMPWRGNNQVQLKSNIQLKSVIFDKNLISAQLQNFISSCLQKNPANRLTIKEMWTHPWMESVKSISKPSSIPVITPSYLLPSVKTKSSKPNKQNENTSQSQTQKATKYSTLDHLVSILNYLRFIFKIFKFVNENKIENKEKLKKSLLYLLLKNLQSQQNMVKSGQNIYKLKGWEQFMKSSKWKVYKSVVDQYSDKYRKLDVDKENIPAQKLRSYISELLTKIKYLKSVEVGNKEMFRNVQALDYLVSLQSLRSLGQRQGWSALLQKSPINNIVECRCHVDVENYIQVLAKLEKKINCIC